MFVGHAAVAAFAAAARPRLPILPLLVAAYAADLIEILLRGVGVAPGIAMLWSHSVTALAAGAALASLLGWLWLRRLDFAVALAAVYASHGLGDLLTGEHKPTWAGGPTYGFGLYQQPAADFAIEIGLVIAAAALYHWRRHVPGRRMAIVLTVVVLLQLGFNLGDQPRLRGLKRDLIRATGAALAPAPASGTAGAT